VRLTSADYLELVSGLLATGTPVTTAVRGLSMCPAILPGDRLRVEPLDSAQVQVGDIVLVRTAAGRALYHRVARISRRRPGWVQTWGDSCLGPDDPVPTTSVLGRVTAVYSAGPPRDLEARRRRARRRFPLRFLRCYLRRLLPGRSSREASPGDPSAPLPPG